MRYLLSILILISIIYSCHKDDRYCFACSIKLYYWENDSLKTLYKDSFRICDQTQDEIDIMESMNNILFQDGSGKSIECDIY